MTDAILTMAFIGAIVAGALVVAMVVTVGIVLVFWLASTDTGRMVLVAAGALVAIAAIKGR